MAEGQILLLRFPSFWGWNKPESEHFLNTRAVVALKKFENCRQGFVNVLLPGATLLWLEENERVDVLARLTDLSAAGRLSLIETGFSGDDAALSLQDYEAEHDTYRRWCKFRKLSLLPAVKLESLGGEQLISLAQEDDFNRFCALLEYPDKLSALVSLGESRTPATHRPPPTAEKKHPEMATFELSRKFLHLRLNQFTERHKQTFAGLIQEERLFKAEGNYHLTKPTSAFFDPYVRRRMYQALISAEVEVDFLERPKVDPNEGWVHLIDHPEEQTLHVHTQLMEALFSERTGAGLSLHYKPRKTNLFSVLDSQTRQAFQDFVVEVSGDVERLTTEQLSSILPPPVGAFSDACQCKLLKRTPSLVSFRFEREFSLSQGNMLSSVGFDFKSGLGAHLPNSTTGFTVEYWIEAVEKPQALIGLQVPLMLPSGAVEGMSAIGLQCVGGVSNLRRSLEEPFFISAQLIPGGLYGLRLIDGVDGFVIDFRSAKGLLGVFHQPIYSPAPHPDEAGEYQGSLFYFLSAAHRIFGDDKANTLFVSIV